MGADDPAVHDLVEVVRPHLGLATGRRDAEQLAGVDAVHLGAHAGQQAVTQVMDIIRAVAPDAGSYVTETDYHQPDWQESFWSSNYAR
jgi:hypothetical protein